MSVRSDGRAAWDAWTGLRGRAGDRCRREFVQTYYEFPAKDLFQDTRGGAL